MSDQFRRLFPTTRRSRARRTALHNSTISTPHIENQKLVASLESVCREARIEIRNAIVKSAEVGKAKIAGQFPVQEWKWYQNGALRETVPDISELATIPDVNNWLGRSLWTADSNFQGFYDEFRIYDYALNQAQILGDLNAGPDVLNVVPESGAAALYPSVLGRSSAFGAANPEASRPLSRVALLGLS